MTNTLLRISTIGLRAASAALRFVVVLVLGVVTTRSAQAQTFTVLYNFASGSSDGIYPEAGLVRDAAGNLYGTATQGGTSGYGTVFKIDMSGTETALHSFTGIADWKYPAAGLVPDAAGNLYGTTEVGGAPTRVGQTLYASQFTGNDLGAKINAATSALPVVGGCPTGTISLEDLNGSQTVNKTIALTTCGSVNLKGPGKTALTLNCTMNGDCIQIRNAAGFLVGNGPSFSGFALNGNSATNAVGIRMGDILNARLDDIDIGNFTGANSVGLWLQNGNIPGGYTEETTFSKIKLYANTIGMRISNNGNANDDSFGYTHFYNFFVQPGCGQTGILSDGGTNVPTLYHSSGDIFLEDQTSTCSPGSVTFLSLAANAVMVDNSINFRGEDQYGSDQSIVLSMGAHATFIDTGLFQFWPNTAHNFMNINGKPCGQSRVSGGVACNFQAGNDIFNVVGRVDFNGSSNWSPVAGFVCSRTSQTGCNGFTLSPSGWGSASAVTCPSTGCGTWSNFTFTITPGGREITANPVMTVIFPSTSTNTTWRNPPAYNCQEINTSDGANYAIVALFAPTTNVQMALQSLITPNSGQTYTFQCIGGGR